MLLSSSFSCTDVDYNSAVLELYLILVLAFGGKPKHSIWKIISAFFQVPTQTDDFIIAFSLSCSETFSCDAYIQWSELKSPLGSLFFLISALLKMYSFQLGAASYFHIL